MHDKKHSPYMTAPEVMALLKLKHAKFYELYRNDPTFPRSFPLSGTTNTSLRRAAYLRTEAEAYASQFNARSAASSDYGYSKAVQHGE